MSVGDAFTVESNVAAASVTADWNIVLDNWDTGDGMINSGDVIICTTGAAAGSPTNARYNLIRTGGNVNTLQQVTTAGNHATNDITLGNTAADPRITLDESTGGAEFNDTVRVNSTTDAGDSNAFQTFNSSGVLRTSIGGNGTFVIRNAANDANNIVLDPNGTGTFEGDVTLSDGSNLVLENADEDQTVSINADDATASYNITLPPAAGTANQLLGINSVTGTNIELEWTSAGGGATGGSQADPAQQDYVFQENAQVVRHDYTVGTTLAAQPGSGATTGTTNAMSAGPITINDGVTVTIENGSNWIVL